MNDSIWNMINSGTDTQVLDNIGFYHTVVWEAVEQLGGDECDYESTLDFIARTY